MNNRWKNEEFRTRMLNAAKDKIVGVIIDGIEYPSIEEASIALNKSKASIWYQINSKREKHANTYTFKKER